MKERAPTQTQTQARLVRVPAALLLHPDLPAPAKLIWMVYRVHMTGEATGTTRLAAFSGLSRPTVLRALAGLRAAGWDPAETGATPAHTVPVPAPLLQNHSLGIPARVLYGILLLTPGFSHPGGQFTHAGLAALARAGTNTVTRAVDQLVQAEWITVERANRLSPVRFVLTFPGFTRGLDALAEAERRLAFAEYRGEAIMREYLSLLIDSDGFEDDAAPGFLVNPRTGARLQLDRFYPPRVAFEFNGPQHYRETAKFTAKQAMQQRERDLIKLGLCVTLDITLVTVHAEDLTLTAMQQKVGALLPLRDLAGYELLAGYLDEEGEKHRRRMAGI